MQAPGWLKALQYSFADSIRTPFDIQEDAYTVQTAKYSAELVAELLPRPPLSGAERLAVYNQQYWFRLLSTLQKEYPLLRRLIGLTEFNRLCTACLTRYPSSEPELHHLPEKLPRFLAGKTPWSRPEVREAARVDLAYFSAFFAEENEDIRAVVLTEATAIRLLQEPLVFHRGWRLIDESFNCIATRKRALIDPEDAPLLTLTEQPGHWVIYRGDAGVTEESISPLQADVLRLLDRGQPLLEACSNLEKQLDEASLALLGAQIQVWFHRWAGLGWFANPD
jgi:hypothetical protein